MRRLIVAAGLTGALAAGAVVVGLGVGQAGESPTDIAAGAEIYAAQCAACHGANLEGQPDWQGVLPDGTRPAPPHDATGHTWHHGDAMLFTYTKHGGQAYSESRGIAGFQSAMPGFGEVLSDAQIRDVLGFIRSTWPDEVQEVQRQRTANE